MKKVIIGVSTSFSFYSQAPILLKSLSIAGPKELIQSERPKRSRAKPPDIKLNNPQNLHLGDNNRRSEWGFFMHTHKTIMGSNTLQNYQEIKSAKID